jgi:hypothetical protein
MSYGTQNKPVNADRAFLGNGEDGLPPRRTILSIQMAQKFHPVVPE